MQYYGCHRIELSIMKIRKIALTQNIHGLLSLKVIFMCYEMLENQKILCDKVQV
jgi:hypothetical protein